MRLLGIFFNIVKTIVPLDEAPDMAEGAMITIAVAVQYALAFGYSYVMYRFSRMRSDNLDDWRVMTRLFGAFAAAFVLLMAAVCQIIVPEFWATPFLLSLWVVGLFFFHDVALGLAIKRRTPQRH